MKDYIGKISTKYLIVIAITLIIVATILLMRYSLNRSRGPSSVFDDLNCDEMASYGTNRICITNIKRGIFPFTNNEYAVFIKNLKNGIVISLNYIWYVFYNSSADSLDIVDYHKLSSPPGPTFHHINKNEHYSITHDDLKGIINGITFYKDAFYSWGGDTITLLKISYNKKEKIEIGISADYKIVSYPVIQENTFYGLLIKNDILYLYSHKMGLNDNMRFTDEYFELGKTKCMEYLMNIGPNYVLSEDASVIAVQCNDEIISYNIIDGNKLCKYLIDASPLLFGVDGSGNITYVDAQANNPNRIYNYPSNGQIKNKKCR